MQVRADPLYLSFAEKSADACLLAHTLPWCNDSHRLPREAGRVLIDDGWVILTEFNPVSLMGLHRLVPFPCNGTPYSSRMFMPMRQLNQLSLFNFGILYCGRYQVLPWSHYGGRLLNTHLPALGCLQLTVTRKRTIPLTLNPIKSDKAKTQLRPAVGAARQWYKGQNQLSGRQPASS